MASLSADGLRRWKPVLSAFVLLNVLDVVTTWLALRLGLMEGNPLPAALLSAGGTTGLFGFKVIATLLVIGVVLRLSRPFPGVWRALRVSNLFLCLIVFLNAMQLLLI